ncbi:MAG: hypothetical protein ACI9VR_000277 [Cognaticolwellia sp.]|jgi:hypothetical protein
MSEGQPEHSKPWLMWVLGFSAVVAALLLSRGTLPPYDDAFFFGRFAQNLLNHGVYAWNPVDGPVHGNTSQLFQLLVTGVSAAAGPYTVSATRLLLGGCLVVAGVVHGRRWGWLTGALTFMGPVALATAVSGMETALVLALGAWFVSALSASPASDRGSAPEHPRSKVLPVLLAIALFTARPDTALLTLGSLGLWGLSGERPLALARLTPAVAALGGMLAALALFRVGYGTAFPLSFYLKSGLTEVYDPAFLAISRSSKLRHLAFFGVAVAPLIVLLSRNLRRSWRLAAPAALFLAYHLVATVDVMGLFARFFAPALPWLGAAAAVNLAEHQARGRPAWVWGGWIGVGGLVAAGVAYGWLPDNDGWAIGRAPPVLYAAAWTAGLVLLVPGRPVIALRGAGILGIAVAAVLAGAPGPRWRTAEVPTDETLAKALIAETSSWRGLEQLRRCLGPELHVYHSEIGVPGVLLPESRITDLGGLMNPALALDGVDADAMCLQDQPDAVFLPHRNYTVLNTVLSEGACLTGYTRVVKRSSSPLFVRNDRLNEYRCD